jgi:hypothetical protein
MILKTNKQVNKKFKKELTILQQVAMRSWLLPGNIAEKDFALRNLEE